MNEAGKKLETNPVKVIRLKCLDCCCGSAKEVALCPAENCSLWPWRFGKNPYRGERTEAQKAAARESMRKLQLARKARETPEEKRLDP